MPPGETPQKIEGTRIRHAPLEDIMWNKISKSRQQDIIVITCGILLILLAKVLA